MFVCKATASTVSIISRVQVMWLVVMEAGEIIIDLIDYFKKI